MLLTEASQFSFLPFQKIFASPSQLDLLSRVEEHFGLNDKVRSGRQKIPIELIEKIFIYCEAENETGIAFRFGLISESGSLGLLDYYLASCKDVTSALQQLIHYFPLLSSYSIKPQINITSEQQLQFTINSSSSDSQQLRVYKEFIFACIISVATRLSNHQYPRQVIFPHQSFSKSVYEKLTELDIEVTFNADYYQFTLLTNQHHCILPFQNQKTINLLKPELDQLLQRQNDSETIIVTILHLFSASKDIAYLNQSQIAEQMNISESSLKRKLAEVGTSFSNILSSYKKEKAIGLLNRSSLSIDYISESLGYSDRSSFERAFKLWTNLTPSQYIQQLSLSEISLQDIKINDINSLPNSPKICQQVFELTKSNNFEIPQLSGLIQQDPILTGKLMSIANSAYYGGKKVTNINQAIIQVLGVDVVQNMVFSLMCCNQMKITNCPEFKLQSFWFQSLFTAEAIKLISHHKKIQSRISTSELFLAALLHKMGDYVIAYIKPDIMNRYLKNENHDREFLQVQQTHFQNQQLKQTIFGLNSETIGSLLLTHWGLPKTVSSIVGEMGNNFEEQSVVAKTLTLFSLFSEHLIYNSDQQDIPQSFLDKVSTTLEIETSVITKSLVKMVNQYDSVHAISKEIAVT